MTTSLTSLARKRQMTNLTPRERELTELIEVLDDRVVSLREEVAALRESVGRLVRLAFGDPPQPPPTAG